MNSQTTAGWIATVIGAVVVAYVLSSGLKNGPVVRPAKETTRPAAAAAPVL